MTPEQLQAELAAARARIAELETDAVAQRRVREEHERLHAVVQNTEDRILLSDRCARPVLFNAAYARTMKELLGLEMKPGLQPHTLLPPDQRKIWDDYHRRVLAGETFVAEYAHETEAGERLVFEMCYTPIVVDGEVCGFSELTRDITARRRTEEALARSEHLLRDTFESIQDGISVLDHDLVVRQVNHVVERWYGQDQPLVGQRCHVCYHGRSEPCSPCPSRRCLETGRTEREIVPGPAGSGVEWLELFAYPLHDPATGEIAGVVEFVRDISERLGAQKEQAKLEEQVRQAQKLESLGILAGAIAHDFNNLLVGILGGADLMQASLDSDSFTPDQLVELRDRVEGIHRAASMASDLTRQMLAYSGQGRLVEQPLSISRLVEDFRDLLRTAVSRNATLDVVLDRDLPAVHGDATQLRQVLMNLAINAAEAIGDRAGTVTVSTGLTELRPQDRAEMYLADDLPPGDYAYLEVADDGCGMDEVTRARMMDPFFTTKDRGRGLGLAAAIGIVRRHGGALQVRSAPEQGTAIRVLLPVIARPARNADDPPPAPQTVDGHGLILVVDDEPIVRTVARQMLCSAGFEVITAVDGSEGVDRFREHADRISAVLLDLTMPRMGGLECLAELRRIQPDAAVVLSSGYAEDEARQRMPEQKHTPFVRKPYRLRELLEAMRGAIAARACPESTAIQGPLSPDTGSVIIDG